MHSIAAQDRYYGEFGGCFMPESLMAAINELAERYKPIITSAEFQQQFMDMLENYAGRATPLTEVPGFANAIQAPTIIFKREDMLHTGAHKINNALGQCLLAKMMGKTQVIAETGAGQHGVATATACAYLGLTCSVYMGAVDVERQQPNVKKMKLLGAKVVSVETGSRTLKDAINEALRDWSTNFEHTHYCLGSALGPHPYPEIVAQFHAVIGREAKQQCLQRYGRLPTRVIACVGGGSNAIGIFSAFLDDDVKLVGVEAGGTGSQLGSHAARFSNLSKGVLHGCYSYVLQDKDGQIAKTHSISAGLDYPSVGPHHAALFDSQRVEYVAANDKDVLEAFKLLSRTEGIIPALESSHALAYVMTHAKQFSEDELILINLSGRGDKDLPQLFAEGKLT